MPKGITEAARVECFSKFLYRLVKVISYEV